jgi:sugar phosphate isomerase/epimerase
MTYIHKRKFSRRDFLKTAVVGAGAGIVRLDRLACATKAAASPPKNIPVGIQIYSVRNAAAKDFPGTVEAIAKLGYKGVEFAGYYGWDSKPKELRKLLDDNGLKCCGTHTGLDTITGDALKNTAELHSILGNPYLIVPSMSAKDEQGWLDLAKKFNDILPEAEALGMRIGYHAHAGDFRKLGESTPWEIFFDNTDKRVLMQIDTGNCMAGGGDPVAMLKKYPGRSLTVHLKENGGPEGAVIGQGVMPWPEIFQACETTGKTLWYIVEHETGPDSLDGIKGCIEGLRKMGLGRAVFLP